MIRMLMRVFRGLRGVVLAGVVVVVLVGCSSLMVDWRAEVDKLDAEISAMPGVQRVEVSYADDFFKGDSLFRLDVHLPEATESQIRDVLGRLGERMGRFKGFREQEIGFVVGDRAKVGTTKKLEVDSFLEAVRNVRRYSVEVPEGSISWDVRPTPEISVSDTQNGGAASLAAIRAMIGDTSAAEVSISTAGYASWSIDLPLSAEREAEFRRRLSEIPLAIGSVEIEGGHIVGLSVRNTVVSTFEPDLVYGQLADTVRKLGVTTGQPLRLRWSWLFYYTDGKRNEGAVHVGGCDYHSLLTVSDDTLSVPALEVQRRMREEFDAC
ncbi:hypothetical protein NDR87_14880 [Nocardia sp. CDC159]|uniref:Uncharacterized protein n=1 Tax=Nocardia pulmonis TaxID=2951408 RepID=A0A9X2E8C8_9NOCA|nr:MULTISPECIES: hypothetical protein [Nocardia]MCM6775624.1 hypothetical protein [Nocardia pulmonis]MCM6787642.1 hypothetical protein [Nocardia sp. CDC159]